MSDRIMPHMQVCKLGHGIRTNVRFQGVPIVQDRGTDSTDLEKCVFAVQEQEKTQVQKLFTLIQIQRFKYVVQQYDIVLLGGLSGRLDQTISTLSCVHQLRKARVRVFVVTDENVGWVLDTVLLPWIFISVN
jgi:thiamine pyrophosphokinase